MVEEGWRHPLYDPAKRTRAAALYAELQSVAKVAEAMGLSKKRAYELLVDAGVLPKDKEAA